jgi:hypothetical protein
VPGFDDYIVFVDESGDHGLVSIDPNYPVFVLAFCIFEKRTYARELVPAMLDFKFKHFGHDQVVLHEHEIRKNKEPFLFLRDAAKRGPFMADLDGLVAGADFTLVASAINKREHKTRYASPAIPITSRWDSGWSACTVSCEAAAVPEERRTSCWNGGARKKMRRSSWSSGASAPRTRPDTCCLSSRSSHTRAAIRPGFSSRT